MKTVRLTAFLSALVQTTRNTSLETFRTATGANVWKTPRKLNKRPIAAETLTKPANALPATFLTVRSAS